METKDKPLRERLKRLLPYVSLVVLFVFLSVASPYFLTVNNLSSVVRQTTVITIMAIGMTVVIASGGIDLSVGSMVGLTGVCGAMLVAREAMTPLALAGAVAVGVGCGLANGMVITLLRIPPFIATLGTLGIYRGVTLILTDGIPVANLKRDFGVLATGNVAGVVPVPLLFMVAVAALVHFVLKYTRLGRYSYAIGSNAEAARCSGIPIGKYTAAIYALGGGLAGLAGMIEAARLVTGQPTAGEGYELRVIAAVVIGGGSLNGGQGTVLGTIVGSFIMGLLSNGCNLLGISPFLQQVIVGAVIVLAVTFDEFQRRRMG
ncbi:MAG: ribose ABC transporter permease [Acidobacteria bacterium]|nr:MAG: ribose ABC transporter permease [Acidobacteriota bacterium]